MCPSIAYAPGNLIVSSGQGQGILLVDGDLTINGNFTFNGLIIIKGAFKPMVGTVNLNGSLQVGGFNGTQTAFGQNQVNIRYSSCALNRTMDATGFATPVRSRSWVRLM